MSVNPRLTSTTYQNQNQSLTITYTYDEGDNAKGKLTSITDPSGSTSFSGKTVPVGTIVYRPLDVIPDNVKQHGVFGSHHNIFTAQQNPHNCKCFWKKEKYVLKPEQITPDMIPIEPFI